MRLFYVANVRMPTEKAHGVQIVKSCEAFANAGYQVELVVPTRVNMIHDDPFAYYGVAPVFTITERTVPDPMMFGRVSFLVAALYFSESVRWMKSFWKAEVVYSRDAVVLLQYLLLGRRFVYEAHGAPTFSARIVACFAYRIVVISKGVGESFVAMGIPREKIVVAPDAVDLDAFAHPESKQSACTRLGLPQDKQIVLYAGRLDGWKGVETLLQSAQSLPASVLVAVIGGEPAQIESLAPQYPNVRFLGFRPYRELADNQAAADVLVLPNTGKSEVSMRYTSPLKLFTYMASGVPIVTSDTPATREILSDDDAYFFTPDDPRALASQIEAALANVELSREKATRAKEKVKAYTWEERAKHILSALATSH